MRESIEKHVALFSSLLFIGLVNVFVYLYGYLTRMSYEDLIFDKLSFIGFYLLAGISFCMVICFLFLIVYGISFSNIFSISNNRLIWVSKIFLTFIYLVIYYITLLAICFIVAIITNSSNIILIVISISAILIVVFIPKPKIRYTLLLTAIIAILQVYSMGFVFISSIYQIANVNLIDKNVTTNSKYITLDLSPNFIDYFGDFKKVEVKNKYLDSLNVAYFLYDDGTLRINFDQDSIIDGTYIINAEYNILSFNYKHTTSFNYIYDGSNNLEYAERFKRLSYREIDKYDYSDGDKVKNKINDYIDLLLIRDKKDYEKLDVLFNELVTKNVKLYPILNSAAHDPTIGYLYWKRIE